MKTPHGHVALLAFAVALAATVACAPGGMEILLFAGPFLLVAGLLLSGRYVGEERILARRAAHVPRRPRPARRIGRPERTERALTSPLERAPRSLRGPPALLAA